jgi:hypothetical protein
MSVDISPRACRCAASLLSLPLALQLSLSYAMLDLMLNPQIHRRPSIEKKESSGRRDQQPGAGCGLLLLLHPGRLTVNAAVAVSITAIAVAAAVAVSGDRHRRAMPRCDPP